MVIVGYLWNWCVHYASYFWVVLKVSSPKNNTCCYFAYNLQKFTVQVKYLVNSRNTYKILKQFWNWSRAVNIAKSKSAIVLVWPTCRKASSQVKRRPSLTDSPPNPFITNWVLLVANEKWVAHKTKVCIVTVNGDR